MTEPAGLPRPNAVPPPAPEAAGTGLPPTAAPPPAAPPTAAAGAAEPEAAGAPHGDAPPEPGTPEPVPNSSVPQHVVTSSRMGAVWAMAVAFAVMLLLLLIFILENGQRVDVAYFGVHGHLPLGVALLLAAVFGILLVVIPGIGRMMQLRWTARRHRRLDESSK